MPARRDVGVGGCADRHRPRQLSDALRAQVRRLARRRRGICHGAGTLGRSGARRGPPRPGALGGVPALPRRLPRDVDLLAADRPLPAVHPALGPEAPQRRRPAAARGQGAGAGAASLSDLLREIRQRAEARARPAPPADLVDPAVPPAVGCRRARGAIRLRAAHHRPQGRVRRAVSRPVRCRHAADPAAAQPGHSRPGRGLRPGHHPGTERVGALVLSRRHRGAGADQPGVRADLCPEVGRRAGAGDARRSRGAGLLRPRRTARGALPGQQPAAARRFLVRRPQALPDRTRTAGGGPVGRRSARAAELSRSDALPDCRAAARPGEPRHTCDRRGQAFAVRAPAVSRAVEPAHLLGARRHRQEEPRPGTRRLGRPPAAGKDQRLQAADQPVVGADPAQGHRRRHGPQCAPAAVDDIDRIPGRPDRRPDL